MSATAEHPAPPISRPDEGTIFLSRRQDLRLVRRPRYEVRGAGGEVVDQIRGEAYQFIDNRLYVPFDGEMKTDTATVMDAQDVKGWLDKHPLNGDIENGFWAAVVPPPAVSKEEFDAVINAALEFDEDTLRAIIDAERSGWARGDFLTSAQEALERMLAAKERLAQQQAEAQAEAAPKPKAKPSAAKE